MKAPFIAFCGIDGCGKTSAIKAIEEKFPKAHVTREPGGTYIAEKIREILLSDTGAILSPKEQMDLFFVARQSHLLEIIEPKRNRGIPVVSDRFDACTFAYQKCITMVNENCFEKQNDLYERFFEHRKHIVSGYEPSLYVYLRVDPEEGIRRRALAKNQEINHFDIAKLGEQKRRHASYEIFFDFVVSVGTSRVCVIDANQNQGKVIHDVIHVVGKEIFERSDS